MGNTKTLVFAYLSMQKLHVMGKVNVLLSPQFYILKKEAIPLKYAYQAKKVAASLFEGYLEVGRSYEYAVSKEGENWVFVAYDVEKIRTFLLSKGLALEQIGKVFFAQDALSAFSVPVYAGEREVLVALEDKVVLVPKTLAEEGKKLSYINESFTPKQGGVSIQGRYGALLSTTQALSLVLFFVSFSAMFFLKGLSYTGTEESKMQMQTLVEENPAFKSAYKRKGIVAKYKKIDQAERKKRESIKTLAAMIFKGVTFTTFRMDEDTFEAHFSCESVSVVKKVQDLAQRANYTSSKTSTSNELVIKGSL